MAIRSYFFNAVLSGGVYDRIYDSEDVTSYLDKLVGNGVFPNPSTNLQVMASDGMTINVLAGQGWIDGHKIINDASLPLTLAAANSLMARIDRIIFYVDYGAREMGIEVKQGTAAASPVPPTLTRTSVRYEMALADITINAGVAYITQANIRDMRGDSSVCGYVQGLIQQIDTTTLWNQFETQFEHDFNAWFDQVKDTLASATLLQKLEHVITTTSETFTTFDVTDYIPDFKFSIDVLEIYVNGLRLNDSEYSLTQSTVTLGTPVTHAGTEIGLVVYKSIDGSDAETIVEQVQTMKTVVDAIGTGMYLATGVDDNKKLSTIVQAFLNGGSDYKQLKIDVYGALGITSPMSTVNGIDHWFDFTSATSTTRRVIIDFADCDSIIIDNAGRNSTRLASTTDSVEIRSMQAVMNNCTNAQLFENEALCTDCALWLNEVGGGAGKLVGATRGEYDNCRISVTGGSGQAYGFSADGGTLRLANSEVLAYNASGAGNESVAVQVQPNQTANVLLMTNCKCPIVARDGYKQSNAVKINSGKYALVGNVLGMAASKYSTGDNMTEIATIIG